MRTPQERMLIILDRLTAEQFLRLFRHFLDQNAYPYPDAAILRDCDMAIIVLLAHASVHDLNRELGRIQRAAVRP